MKKTRKMVPTPRKKLNTTARASSRRIPDDAFYDDEPNMKLSRAFIVVLILHVVAVGGILVFNNMKAGRTLEPGELLGTTETSAAAVASVESVATPSRRHHFLRAGETLTRVASIYNVSVPDLVKVNNLRNDATLQVGQRLIIPNKNGPIADAAPAAPTTPPLPTMSAQNSHAVAPVAPARLSTADLVSATEQRSTPAATSSVSNSGQTYTVVKGDNPVGIARQLGVNYQQLLDLNGIEDPRLLQIGQVLKVPAK